MMNMNLRETNYNNLPKATHRSELMELLVGLCTHSLSLIYFPLEFEA